VESVARGTAAEEVLAVDLVALLVRDVHLDEVGCRANTSHLVLQLKFVLDAGLEGDDLGQEGNAIAAMG